MKKIFIATLMLVLSLTSHAQTDASSKGMNTMTEEYMNKEEGTLTFENPKIIVLKKNHDGYNVKVVGEHNGYDYEIEFTQKTEPQQYITVSTNGIMADLDKSITLDNASRLTLSKDKSGNSVQIVRDGYDDTYFIKIESKGKLNDNRTVYRESSSDWKFSIPFNDMDWNDKNEKNHSKASYAQFDLGILSDLEFGMGLVSAHSQAPGMDVEFGNAGWEFILNNLVKFEYRPFRRTSLSLGFGVDWRNYRMKGDKRFMKEGNNLVVAPYPDGADIDFSRVKVFSMTLELLFRQGINKRVSVAVGPVVNFNTHASIKTRYTVGNGKEKQGFKETSSNIHQKPVTIDFKGVLTIDPISFYFKYSPTNTLNTDYGPEFKSMSAGLMITL